MHVPYCFKLPLGLYPSLSLPPSDIHAHFAINMHQSSTCLFPTSDCRLPMQRGGGRKSACAESPRVYMMMTGGERPPVSFVVGTLIERLVCAEANEISRARGTKKTRFGSGQLDCISIYVRVLGKVAFISG